MVERIKKESNFQLAVVRPCCAAVDVGSMLMVVSYSDKEGNQFLLKSDAFTRSLEEVAGILAGAGVEDVAMEATGVYWMSLFGILEDRGMKVVLTNPRHFKNVDGQKTDVNDSQWLHQLHAHGLLRSSHIAGDLYRKLRAYLHERNLVQRQKSDMLNRMQRQLSVMNLKVQHLVSDMEGVAGMKLLRAIAAGITDPAALLGQINASSLAASQEDLLQSHTGHYKPQYVEILRHHLAAYDFFMVQMKEYELLIGQVLQEMLPGDEEGQKPEIKKKTTKARKNEYSINIREHLKHIVGVDLTLIDGLDEINLIEIISVTGTDMSKWKTADNFASWLNLACRHKISGDKVIGKERRFTKNQATQAFRLAAQAMWRSKGPLGVMYRKIAGRNKNGAKIAIKAVARKIAVIFYNMIKNKTEYDAGRVKEDSVAREAGKVAYIRRQAAKYGYSLQSVAT